jgi:hypothetical protein
MFRKLAILLLIAVVSTSCALGATLTVGSGGYKTIQSAVDNAKDGDTIVVNSGTYNEYVNVTQYGISILGKNYPKVNGFFSNIDPFSDFGTSEVNINGFKIMKNGVYLGGKASRGNIIRNNYFYNCGASITGEVSNGNIINNQFFNGGIGLFDASATITGNQISNSKVGIIVSEGVGGGGYASEISGNNISGCTVGIEFNGGSAGIVYNNYFNNKQNIKIDSPIAATWNVSQIRNYNILLGPYIAGNFWGAPNGKGFSQTASDNNYDGIADGPYVIDINNIDYLPLVAIKKPIASFKMSKSSIKVNNYVYFTDTSKGVNMTEKWTFGDGSSSTSKNPSHKYTKVGKFKVTLTETNKAGSSSKYQYATVTR